MGFSMQAPLICFRGALGFCTKGDEAMEELGDHSADVRGDRLASAYSVRSTISIHQTDSRCEIGKIDVSIGIIMIIADGRFPLDSQTFFFPPCPAT